MESRPDIPSITLAAGSGALFAVVLGAIWGYYAANHPFNGWLIDSLLKNGYVVAYYLTIYMHDFLLNAIIALPFAYVVARLRPRFSWQLLAAAVAVAVSVVYWPVFVRPRAALFVLADWRGLIPLVILVGSLPVGFAVLKLLSKRGSADAV